MTNYDVIKNASKKDMATLLALLVAGALGGDLSDLPELTETLLEFLDQEARV